MAQAAAGRVVMSVDCTALLNLRHYTDPTAAGADEEGRVSWMTEYPHDLDDTMSFDEVTRYPAADHDSGDGERMAIVTYGNGVVTALQAVAQLPPDQARGVTVIDSPYLSSVPGQLREAMGDFDAVLFAEICKDGPGAPLLSHACALHNEGVLPKGGRWGTVAAARAYNPLGNTITFLGEEVILDGLQKLREQ